MVLLKQQLKATCVIDSPLGKLALVVQDSYIVAVIFLSPKTPVVMEKNAVVCKEQGYLRQYFAGMCPGYMQYKCYAFSALVGTHLQKKIWRQIQNIPFFILCHRVIAVHGIGGYCGKSKHFSVIKKYLLQYEAKHRGN